MEEQEAERKWDEETGKVKGEDEAEKEEREKWEGNRKRRDGSDSRRRGREGEGMKRRRVEGEEKVARERGKDRRGSIPSDARGISKGTFV